MNKHIMALLLTYCTIIILLSGCWDAVDIEDRGFVVGSAIDMGDKRSEGNYNVSVTNQIIVPAGYGTPEQGAGEEEAVTNVTASGESMIEIARKMAAKTSRVPYFEHLKVIIISEKIAKEPNLIASLLDIYIRDQEMRRGVKVLIAEGEAKHILDVEPKTERFPVKFINSIIENSDRSIVIIDPVKIGKVHKFLLEKSSYVLPRVLFTGKGMDEVGVAVFHGYNNKMVGVLNGEETKGLNLITQKNKNGVITFDIDKQLMAFEIEKTKSKIEIDTKDPENINIAIKITAEGAIAEMFGSKSLLDSKYISEIEEQVAKRIEQLVNLTVERGQKELKADVFGFNNILKQKHSDMWKQIESNWDHGENYFEKSNITVSADVEVRTIGATDKAKDIK